MPHARLVCIDVDGTLVGTGGRVAERVWPAVEAARARGVALALCSGRPAFGVARDYAVRVAPAGWHVFQNGASIVNLGSGESRSTAIAPAAVLALRARAERTGDALELYTETEYAVESTSERVVRHAGLLGVPFAPRSFASLGDRPVVRGQWLVAHERVDAILAEPHEGYELRPSTSPVMPDTNFVNIVAPGVDKASAVRVLAEIHGLTLADVMFIGDGENDLAAMAVVGVPVAMGNAAPAIKALAKHHVPSVDDGGVADALALLVPAAFRGHPR